jgi:hypothetical protein
MDPRDPKFQLLAGMMSGKEQTTGGPGCGCAVIAAIAFIVTCLVVAGLAAR